MVFEYGLLVNGPFSIDEVLFFVSFIGLEVGGFS